MDTFESLENLNVSEECFEDIMSIVEDLLKQSITQRNNADSRFKSKNLSKYSTNRQDDLHPRFKMPTPEKIKNEIRDCHMQELNKLTAHAIANGIEVSPESRAKLYQTPGGTEMLEKERQKKKDS